MQWITERQHAVRQAKAELRRDPHNKAAQTVVEAGVRSPLDGTQLPHTGTHLTENRVVQKLARSWREGR